MQHISRCSKTWEKGDKIASYRYILNRVLIPKYLSFYGEAPYSCFECEGKTFLPLSCMHTSSSALRGNEERVGGKGRNEKLHRESSGCLNMSPSDMVLIRTINLACQKHMVKWINAFRSKPNIPKTHIQYFLSNKVGDCCRTQVLK